MIRWTGLAPWEFQFPFPGSLTYLVQDVAGAEGEGGRQHDARPGDDGHAVEGRGRGVCHLRETTGYEPLHGGERERERETREREARDNRLHVQWFPGGLVVEAHRLLYHSA